MAGLMLAHRARAVATVVGRKSDVVEVFTAAIECILFTGDNSTGWVGNNKLGNNKLCDGSGHNKAFRYKLPACCRLVLAWRIYLRVVSVIVTPLA
tara:strand:- start:2368 stop:2652 length:285 start_codon:yes stop_codon:yes gene_type:complete